MGLLDWTRRQPKRAKEVAKNIVAADQIKKGSDFIVEINDSLRPKTIRQESFRNAAQRLNVSEEQIPETYKFFSFRFFLFSGFFVLSLIMTIVFLSFGKFAAIGGFGFMAICAAQCFNASFRMMQIRYRELLSVSFWLANPKEWWYQKLPTSKNTKR